MRASWSWPEASPRRWSSRTWLEDDDRGLARTQSGERVEVVAPALVLLDPRPESLPLLTDPLSRDRDSDR